MSADAWIVNPPCSECGRDETLGAEVNITYNLSPMLHEAGFCGWGNLAQAPTAEAAGQHLLAVLDGMQADPERWRAMDPENGWGSYDRCLQVRLRLFAEECVAAGPRARVVVSR